MKHIKATFNQYPEILASRNQSLDDCDIHQFCFKNRNQNSLHYDIMEAKVPVLLYDTHNNDEINSATGGFKDPLFGTVFITLKKEETMIGEIIQMAKQLGGEYCGIVNPFEK